MATVQPRRQQAKPAHKGFDPCGHTAAHNPSPPLLKVSTSVIHVNTWITTHFPIPEDRKLSWSSWLTHSGQFTNKVVTCQPQIRRLTGKVRRPNRDVLTTELRRQVFMLTLFRIFTRLACQNLSPIVSEDSAVTCGGFVDV